MATAQDVLAEARSYLGCKWVHQGETRTHGVDCVGVVWCVGRATGFIPETAKKPPYGPVPNGRLRKYASELFDEVWYREGSERVPLSVLRPARIALIAWRREPLHLAWIGEVQGRPTFIHSYADIGKVIEHGISKHWHNRIVGVYNLRGLV